MSHTGLCFEQPKFTHKSGLLRLLCNQFCLISCDVTSDSYCNNSWGRRVRIGFSDRVWRDQPRGHPKGAVGPEGCPRGWSRHTRSGKPYKHEHGWKYWHSFLSMDNHPTGWPLLYETPLGMICLHGKVMYYTVTSHWSHWKTMSVCRYRLSRDSSHAEFVPHASIDRLRIRAGPILIPGNQGSILFRHF